MRYTETGRETQRQKEKQREKETLAETTRSKIHICPTDRRRDGNGKRKKTNM